MTKIFCVSNLVMYYWKISSEYKLHATLEMAENIIIIVPYQRLPLNCEHNPHLFAYLHLKVLLFLNFLILVPVSIKNCVLMSINS